MSAKWLFTFKHFKFPLLPLLTHSALVTCPGTSNLASLTPLLSSQEMYLLTSRFDLHKKNSCWVRKIQAYIYKYSRERIPSITTQFVEIYDSTTFLSDQLTSLSPGVYCWNISFPIFDWSWKYFFADIWLILMKISFSEQNWISLKCAAPQ